MAFGACHSPVFFRIVQIFIHTWTHKHRYRNQCLFQYMEIHCRCIFGIYSTFVCTRLNSRLRALVNTLYTHTRPKGILHMVYLLNGRENLCDNSQPRCAISWDAHVKWSVNCRPGNCQREMLRSFVSIEPIYTRITRMKQFKIITTKTSREKRTFCSCRVSILSPLYFPII